MVTLSNNSNIKFKSEFTSPTKVSSLENSTTDIKIVKSEENPVNIISDNIEVKKERKSLILSKTLSSTSLSTSSTTTSTSASVSTSVSISTEPKDFHQHDPILRNEDGSMLTTPRNIPMVITKDQNKLIHLDPVPNFQDKAEIKPWLQKIFYPMGIEIVIERSDNTKVIFKCKASKRGRKSRKSTTTVTPNKVTSTFEDTVKECAEKFIVHSDIVLKKQTSENVKEQGDSKNSTSISPKPVILSSQPPRVKKKRAISRFNVCPFRIRATYSLKRRKWSIVVLNNTHSHELNFDPNSEEYKKFKAKLRENNDIEAIKKFDELEYRKRCNLPIHTAMIPCDCGLTNEIESFNIVIPNVNAVKSTSTPTIFNNIPNDTDYPKTNNVHNDSNKIVTPTINGDNNKRKTIHDLIMQKNRKNSIIERGRNDASILNTEFTTVDNTNNIHISEVPPPLSTLPEQQQTSIINKSLDWGVQEKSNNYNNVNPLYQNLITNSNNNNNDNNNYEHNYKNNFDIDYNHLGTFYGLSNNDSHTEIIRAKTVIRDEENDEELGNYVQRVNDDYTYNGNNNVIANEYYHNDFDSYNTDHFYKFNGPFDSGNIIISNDYNHFINSISNNDSTHRHDSIYNTSDDCSNANNTNNNNNSNNNRYSTLTNIHNNSDNNMNNNITNNNYNNTINGNITVNNSYNHYYNRHIHEMDDDLLLINNFIDDPVFNESHLNMMNLHSINLETPFHNKHNDNTTTVTNSNNNNNNTNTNNNANVNLIDLNEIDFTDIFINNGYNTMNRFIPRNSTIIKNKSSKEELEKPEVEKNVGALQQNSISNENLQKELNQFVNNSNETKEPKKK